MLQHLIVSTPFSSGISVALSLVARRKILMAIVSFFENLISIGAINTSASASVTHNFPKAAKVDTWSQPRYSKSMSMMMTAALQYSSPSSLIRTAFTMVLSFLA